MASKRIFVGPLSFVVEDTIGPREDDVDPNWAGYIAERTEIVNPAEPVAPNGYTTEDGYDADDVEDWEDDVCPECGNDIDMGDVDFNNGFCPICGAEI